MLLEFMLIFEVVALGLVVYAFTKGGIFPWALAIILFGILAFSFYNVEETKVLVTGINDTVLSPTETHSSLNYQLYTKSSQDIPLVYINMGLGAICLVFLFMEIFKWEW